MKKIIVVLMCLCLAIMVFPARIAATGPYYEAKGNNTIPELVSVKTIVSVTTNNSYGKGSGTVDITKSYSYNGNEVASVTLTVTFGYNGSSAWVISRSVSKNLSSGWSYSGQNISITGGTVSLTAQLSKNTIHIPVDISVTCSPSGEIS